MEAHRYGLAEGPSEVAGAPGDATAPAMNRREVALAVADQERDRHWSQAECWCRAVHPAESADLVLVPAPWDASRDLESAGAAGDWS
jgi:hypothetical protein